MHDAPNDGPAWFKSSYSGGPGSDCVEVAPQAHGLLIRDSKDPLGPVLDFDTPAITAFLDDVRTGRLGAI